MGLILPLEKLPKKLRPASIYFGGGRSTTMQINEDGSGDLWIVVQEHHVAAAERHAANIAEAESQKGVRGTARRVRKALTGKQQGPGKKGKK